MKYVVAVSGGVDSVVLLDMLAHAGQVAAVAHFDHGIRPESSADARFVAGLAAQYDVPFELKREELGATASEDTARRRRYDFLKSISAKYGARLTTAHHADDMVESIVINLIRGTGWRGLATMGDASIHRPLLTMTKNEIYAYALAHSLEWVEDETNQTDAYLRNRVRRKLASLNNVTKQSLSELRNVQIAKRAEIEIESQRFADVRSRYFYTMIPRVVAIELLRQAVGRRLTGPQLEAGLLAIKVAKPGAVMEAGGGVTFHMRQREFIVKIQ